MKKLLAGVAAATVAVTPIAASAVESQPVVEENELGAEGGAGVVIAIIAAAAIIAGIIIAADGDDDDGVSP